MHQLSLLIFAQVLAHMMVEAAIIGNSSDYKMQAVQIIVRYVGTPGKRNEIRRPRIDLLEYLQFFQVNYLGSATNSYL